MESKGKNGSLHWSVLKGRRRHMQCCPVLSNEKAAGTTCTAQQGVSKLNTVYIHYIQSLVSIF